MVFIRQWAACNTVLCFQYGASFRNVDVNIPSLRCCALHYGDRARSFYENAMVAERQKRSLRGLLKAVVKFQLASARPQGDRQVCSARAGRTSCQRGGRW